MAAQVTSLAAKMLSENPQLSAADIRIIVIETATEEGEQKLKVVHPRNALAAARARIK